MQRHQSPKQYLINAAVDKAVNNSIRIVKKELQQYIDEQLNHRCNTTESISSESAGLQTIIDDLRDELSETRKQLDAVTLERNAYKSKTELTECKLWDEQDNLHEQIAELKSTNQELMEKVKHLTAQNENLNKLINYGPDTTTSENTPENTQSTYIVFNRTLLTDFLKTTDLTSVIAHISIPEDHTFAYIYDRITSQLQERNRNVASFQDYYIIEIPN